MEQIASEPFEFSLVSPLQNSFKPIWGAPCALPCPTGQDFTFTSQAQIDDFGTTYATCTNISLGNVTISGSDINNLDGLANVSSISGFLNFLNNMALADIDGLNNLNSIGGNLVFQNNDILTNIDGLSNLSNIGGTLAFSTNAQLSNLNGLSNINSINGDLQIFTNPQLSNLGGLSNITNIQGALAIIGNAQLTNLDSLSSLVSIQDNLGIINTQLTNLNGLANLTNIGGELFIEDNAALTDISGIQNIDPTTIGGSSGLEITNNSNLAVCNLPNICTYLAGTGPRTISGNLAECVNEASVLAACDPCPSGNVLYVNTSASGANNGKTWADAYNSLQNALENPCPTVTEIWVAAGTYKPSAYPAGCSGCSTNRDFTFLLKDGVSLYGGFDGTETMLSERDFASNETILSGDFNGDDVVTGSGSSLSISNNTENAYHVLVSVSDAATTVLDGFTVSGGNANGFFFITLESNSIDQIVGGGMLNYDSHPSITNTSFISNSAGDEGGGLHNRNSNPNISNTTITGNFASDFGGGIYNRGSHPSITNTTFIGNSSDDGGGMYNRTSNPSITNTSFTSNSVSFDGGGIYNKDSFPDITNSIYGVMGRRFIMITVVPLLTTPS